MIFQAALWLGISLLFVSQILGSTKDEDDEK